MKLNWRFRRHKAGDPGDPREHAAAQNAIATAEKRLKDLRAVQAQLEAQARILDRI